MTKSKEIKALVARANVQVNELEHFERYLDSIDQTRLNDDVYAELEFRLSHIKDLSNEYKEVCIQISANSTEEEDILSPSEFFNRFVAANMRSKCFLTKKPSAVNARSLSDTESVNTNPRINARLPKLSIPDFNGEYTTFTSFYETFTALIHTNHTLTDVERFMYLRDSLKGPAKQLISNIQPTGENYRIAFELLCERFNNPKLIINSHISGIFNLKPVSKDSAVELRSLYDDLNKHLRALDNITVPFDNKAAFLAHILMTKFDINTRKEFSRLKPKEIPTLADINEFLKERCEVLEEMETNRNLNQRQDFSKTDFKKNSNYFRNNDNKSKPQIKQTLLLTNTKITCPNCREQHSLSNCTQFLTLSVQQKIERVNELKVCKNCLYHSNQRTCNSRYSCQICKRKHHTLLHLHSSKAENIVSKSNNNANNAYNAQIIENASEISNDTEVISRASAQSTLSCFNNSAKQVILPTAIIRVKGTDQEWRKARVLLDSGSHINLITESMANKLKLKREETNIKIFGINSTTSRSNASVKLQIASLCSYCSKTLSCVIIEKIAENLPLVSFNKSNLSVPENIKLADEHFNKSAQIDILIGASLFYDLMSAGQISLGKGQPVLKKTLLGWVVAGNCLLNKRQQMDACTNLILDHTPRDLDNELKNSIEKFWQLEDTKPRHESSKLTPEERFCEIHFQETVRRDNTGRFVVSIPFHSKLSCLGESKTQALNRFLKLEKSLQGNPVLHHDYRKFMEEYITLGHMKPINLCVQSDKTVVSTYKSQLLLSDIPDYYLPHHAVMKSDSLTTKLRVVFDGSAKSQSGISINDTQIVGPVIQSDLLSILLRFRQHLIAMTGDLEKMYRQILIEPSLQKFQQIFWRDSPDVPIESYVLQTITYGTASASYLATKCLQHLAMLNSEKYPFVSEILKRDFYMDDLLTGGDSVEEVLKLRTDITNILSTARLPIRKFLSNSLKILPNEGSSETNYFTVPLGERGHAKTLGIFWNALTDNIQYNALECSNERITKRSILSSIAKLFDPLGLISPVVVKGKLLMQTLWQLKLAWDESLPENIDYEWRRIKNQFPALSKFKIPRCIKIANTKTIELHGFCDSSSVAYGACVYVRCIDLSSNIQTNLLCAKSRISPLHGTTIPRLELCAAVLLSELLQKVKESLTLKFDSIFLWTDSMIVLNWINSTPNRYKVFVSNRIAAIQELTENCYWRHVPSQENPADLISRGALVNDLIDNSFWFFGPKFLSSSSEWPLQKFPHTNLPHCELKITRAVTMTIQRPNTFELFSLSSKLNKLVRILAWILRFKHNTTANKFARTIGPLNAVELQQSQNILIKLCQAETFPKELKILQENKKLKSSKIIALNPFLGTDGIMRVGGRIRNSDYSFEKKFPILLPKNHQLTKLIFSHFHERLLHCGAQQLLFMVREQYWPIAGRNTAKMLVHGCVKCFRASPKQCIPLMGDLPKKRLARNLPAFSNTGVDYAGPILIKDRKTRKPKLLKSYVCLFVCLVTKAVHLELLTDLTANAFIAVLKRFISRRGVPITITSDNAKNFKGASNQLRELYKFLNFDENKVQIHDFLANKQIKWEFITPRAPHQGGIWESNIKSVKLHLKRVLGNVTLNYEDFQTLLVQIEAILNSRPLCPLSSDPSDLQPLTPGHFLVGKPICALPEADYTCEKESRLKHYQQIQRSVQAFWKRWSREVIPELQRRTKWFRNLSNLLQVGAVVLVKEDNVPSTHWILGRVAEVHTSNDNIPRSATVILAQGKTVRRPVQKLCVLPEV